MIKPFTFFVLSMGMVCLAKAQDPDVSLATVRYELVHVNDTNDRDNPRKEQMAVHLGQQASVYFSHTRAAGIKALREKMAARNAAGGDAIVSFSMAGEQLFHFPQLGKHILVDAIQQTQYVVELPDPAIDWQIEDEVREIGGYEVQKATGSFGGRDYTVWFATELPFPYGPWKLYGLPGLILEAADSRNEVAFNFVELSSEGGEAIALPENTVKTSFKEFSKAKEVSQKNPMVPAGGVGAGSDIVFVRREDGVNKTYRGDEARAMIQKAHEEHQRKNNNPLERTTNP